MHEGTPLCATVTFVTFLRLLHEGDLLRCFRNSGSVTYVSTLPSPWWGLGALRHLALILRPCISSFVPSLSTFESNVRERHFVQHSLFIGTFAKDSYSFNRLSIMEKKLYRSNNDRMVGGVCGGIAEYFNIDSSLVRILWMVFTLMGGSGLLAYIICLIVIPSK